MTIDDRNSGDDGCPTGFEDCTLNNNKNIVYKNSYSISDENVLLKNKSNSYITDTLQLHYRTLPI